MDIISVRALTKAFEAYNRREGILGSVKDLFHREYRTVTAVDAIEFSVPQGELVGFIGPNGAGKSTTIKMLTGILKPTSGEMTVSGFHPYNQRREYTRHIGVVFGQRTQLWWDIAAIESFRLLGAVYGVPKERLEKRIQLLTDVLDIGKVLHSPVRKLSLGERMRCDMAASLLHEPPILFLDEPTIGLDALAKESVRNFLRHVNKELRTTIILTTHDLKEIEELCQRVIILDKGKIIYDGSITSIKQLPGLCRTVVVEFREAVAPEALNTLFAGRVEFMADSAKRYRARFDQVAVSTVDVLRALLGAYEIVDLTIDEPDIEEVVKEIYTRGVVGE